MDGARSPGGAPAELLLLPTTRHTNARAHERTQSVVEIRAELESPQNPFLLFCCEN